MSNDAATPFFLGQKIVDGDLKYPDEPSRFHRQNVEPFFKWATDQGASDITIQSNKRIFLEIDGKMFQVTKHILDHSEVMEMVVGMYKSDSAKGILAGDTALDFAYKISPTRDERFRFRVNVVGCDADGGPGVQITARTIPSVPPLLSSLNVEPEITNRIAPSQGMVVVCGGTGSGKSTLLASIVRYLLEQPQGHRKIITFEAPIEYVYDEVVAPTSSISQTEIGKNLKSFVEGVRNALRRKPSIILLGEARDAETIGEAVTASMTGHLLYTTIHSNDFASTIRRMVNVFEDEKNARAVDIISSLRMVICQRLVPATNGKRIALREYVVMNDEIAEYLLSAGIDNLSLSCRKVLKEYGQSFAQDATKKFNQGLISKKVWKEFMLLEEGRAKDALEASAQQRHKIAALAPALNDEPSAASGVEPISPRSSLDVPEWPDTEPELTLKDN